MAVLFSFFGFKISVIQQGGSALLRFHFEVAFQILLDE